MKLTNCHSSLHMPSSCSKMNASANCLTRPLLHPSSWPVSFYPSWSSTLAADSSNGMKASRTMAMSRVVTVGMPTPRLLPARIWSTFLFSRPVSSFTHSVSRSLPRAVN